MREAIWNLWGRPLLSRKDSISTRLRRALLRLYLEATYNDKSSLDIKDFIQGDNPIKRKAFHHNDALV